MDEQLRRDLAAGVPAARERSTIDHLTLPAAEGGRAKEALEDCQSHRRVWREALMSMKRRAKVTPPDIDDKAYWRHEIEVFDRTFDVLATLPSEPLPDQSERVSRLEEALRRIAAVEGDPISSDIARSALNQSDGGGS
jgi:hypothetical protein